MKKVIISILVSVLVMLVLPYIIVEFAKPKDNATSTKPVAPTISSDAIQV